MPKFSILNPALTQTLPPYQTAAGITDIMAHLYERYLTNTKEVEVTDRMIEALNRYKDDAPTELLGHIRNKIDGFVQDAEQFDDLTMLAFVFNGPESEVST